MPLKREIRVTEKVRAGAIGDQVSLADYLYTRHREIEERVEEIDRLLSGIAVAFLRSRGTNHYWLPQWDGGTPPSTTTPSISTQAMCVVGLQKLTAAFSGGRRLLRLDELNVWHEEARALIAQPLRGGAITSDTYGADSPVVLNWLTRAKLVDATQLPASVMERLSKCLEAPDDPRFLPITRPDNHAGAHAFPMLSAVRLAIRANLSNHLVRSAGRWFERRLHEQISYERLQDFRFDAAELTFALLGSLECGVVDWDSRTVRQVLEVIRKAQKRSVYWRPYRPFLATDKGTSLLNLSIEVANALIEIIQFPKTHSPRPSDVNDQFRRDQQALGMFAENAASLDEYYSWLVGQRQRFTPLEVEAAELKDLIPIGWLSENVQADPSSESRMHTWATSQVALFLVDYRHLLRRFGQQELVRRSRFSQKAPGELVTWANVISVDGSRIQAAAERKNGTLGVIEDMYVRPHAASSGATRYYSLLLYGPPGTSKTTIAQGIAARIGWPLITISPSDFLTDGMEQVEFRAKTIFDVLMRLDQAVILFDEIDALMPDRKSEEYQRTSGVLKFMTPSMLVKLNDLRKREQVIFIVATNFAERIDAAIKRKGRFDAQFLVPPFDLAGRAEVLTQVAADAGMPIEALSAGSVLAVYEELKDLARRIWPQVKGPSDGVRRAFGQFRPSLVEHMQRRVAELTESEVAEDDVHSQDRAEEVFALYGLLLESKDALDAPEFIKRALALNATAAARLSRAYELFISGGPYKEAWKALIKSWLDAERERLGC